MNTSTDAGQWGNPAERKLAAMTREDLLAEAEKLRLKLQALDYRGCYWDANIVQKLAAFASPVTPAAKDRCVLCGKPKHGGECFYDAKEAMAEHNSPPPVTPAAAVDREAPFDQCTGSITLAFEQAGWEAVAQIAEDRGDIKTAEEARRNAERAGLTPAAATIPGGDREAVALRAALKTAIAHCKHMAAWIGGVQLEGKPAHGKTPPRWAFEQVEQERAAWFNAEPNPLNIDVMMNNPQGWALYHMFAAYIARMEPRG